MLDAGTKARIDSARDILVGKVPDPKSQVEQITIALIYKFMDDMDRQSEELGGKASFFTGKFKRYRWGHLLDKRLGGHERLLLYAEGIEKMNENAGIPHLFRDIFKGVFLPYRDPETLNLFLKEVNGFSYDHSERLGDAYEYLLNILGTQGDAGQFRTPRHIIDFIVAIVDPQKHETVLDPACGTAGFLISAFKHILKANEDLSPDDRGRLMTNFAGYDIAPDMVRLSRVNMYLHGFPNPTIHEYDALTSEERWDERYDIIMANPPFMTPKGGIRPHNRFAIKAKRSEVLFVDYISEHLNPGGRAGIIVPEGIIFQSQNAYKNLRRMLVEGYLWAVVSLPAGIFNPYSGVKTSVLFLDKNMAKRTRDVLFVKIANDGFDLGAQRRPIEGSELPEALKILSGHKKASAFAKASADRQKAQEGKAALTVSRERLLESPDCNLSGERYRETVHVTSEWSMVPLGDVCRLVKDAVAPQEAGKRCFVGLDAIESGTGRLINSVKSNPPKSTKWSFNVQDILYGKLRPNLNKVWLADRSGICSTDILVFRCQAELASPEFVRSVLLSDRFNTCVMKGLCGAQLPRVKPDHLIDIPIPLPPIEEQERIAAELDSYRKVIEGAQQVVENYKPTIRIDPEWPCSELGAIVRNLDGKRVPIEKGKRKPGPYPYYGASGIVDYVDSYIFDGDYLLLSEDGANLVRRTTRIAFSVSGKVWVNNHAHILAFDDPVTRQFVEHYINGIDISGFVTGAAQPKLSQTSMNRILIPLPPLDTRREIVTALQAEQAMVESSKNLIEIFEKKIQAKLAEVWGEEPGGPAEVNPEIGGNNG